MSMIRNALSASSRPRLAAVPAASRAFHYSPVARKTTTEKVADVADKVNKTVGRTLASAIETGEQATQATKDTLNLAKDKTKETAAAGSQKANQTAAGIRQGSRDFSEDVKKEARK